MLLPGRGRLAQLIAQHGPLGVLRLPAHKPRPGCQQRLVDDLDPAAPRLGVVPAGPFLVLDQQPRVDQAAQHGLRFGALLAEDRQQLVVVADRAGPLRGDQVAEQLAHDRQVLRADPLDRGLRVLGQGAPHPADPRVGRAGQESRGTVALLPQPRRGEGQQRQRAPFARHGVDHLRGQVLVLEAVAALQRGLDDRAAEGRPGRGPEHREIGEHRDERRVLVTAHEEVVPQRDQHVDVGLDRRRGRAAPRSGPGPRRR